MSLTFRFCGISDVGIVRSNNEDVWAALPEVGFFALADGMGGHLAGEVAARETVEHVGRVFARRLFALGERADERLEVMRAMHGAVESANHWVYQMSKKHRGCSGMGTTLCCLYWSKEAIVYAHVGDSRLYRWRNGKLELLTKDHSLWEKWLGMGRKAEECKTPYPYKHVITKAIGTHAKSHPEIASCTYEPGDLFLLCTDGLSDVLSADEMLQILDGASSLDRAAEKLVEQSKIKGSSDNITVLIVQCEDADKNLFRQQLDDRSRSARF